jgi:RNA recognition motif-containing protein
VVDVAFIRDKVTNEPKGMGFVEFTSREEAEAAEAQQHSMDGRQVSAHG